MTGERYPTYRPSGVEWLDEIPEHWEVKRIAALFSEVAEQGADDLPILSVSIHDGVSDKELNPEEMDRKVTRSDDRSKYKRVARGDLVYNMMRAWQGGFGAVEIEGMVSPAYVVARPKGQLSARFTELLLRTPAAVEEMRRRSRGVTDFRLRLYWEEFKGIEVVVPSPTEQEAILAFLDRETAKIDALVVEQKRLIDLLQEKRQAVISHAVTKGLNPNAPMKDSGGVWLREVPEHWVVAPLKHFVQFLDGKRVPLSAEERSHRQGPYPYYGASGIIDSIDSFIFEEDLILVGEDGANLVNRSTPLAFVASGQYWVNNHAHILRPLDLQIGFWVERIEAIDFVPFVTGSAQPKLTIDALANVVLAAPPTQDERAEVASYVTKAKEDLDPLISAAEKSIELLRERRAALISAAVTGKMDVSAFCEQEAA